MKELSSRLKRYTGIVFIIMLASSLVALLLSSKLRRVISEPILALAQTMKVVSINQNYSVRALKYSEDEIGLLIDGFNQMLARIQSRDEELSQYRDHLEELVKERTTELTRLNQQLKQEITVREQAEEAFRGLSSRYEAILAAVADIIMEVDRNKVYTWANQAGFQFFGEEVLGKEAEFYFEGEQDTYDTVQPLFSGDQNLIYLESWQRRQDGQKRLLAWWCRVLKDANGSMIGALSTARDITAQKRAEAALRQSEEKYRSLVANIPDVTWTSDAQGNTVFISPNIEQVYGFTQEEIYQADARLWFGRIHPAEVELVKEAYGSLFTKNQRFDVEYRIQRKDGHWIWLHDKAIATYEKDGLMYADGVFSDITPRVRAQEALKEMEAQVAQSEKMASLGMLVAGVAHEINTPVGAINSMHNTLVRAVEKLKSTRKIEPSGHEGQPVSKLLRIIDNANRVITSGTERVTNIVRRLKSFARLDEAELKIVDIHLGIEDTLTMVHHQLKHKAVVECNFGDLPLIPCYPSQLNQVYLNLLINAVQAIEDKGKITITTFQKDDYVHVQIKDTGIGIPQESRSKIFDPGYTTKDAGVGTGLGLSICYRIVKEHDGEIMSVEEQLLPSYYR
jgi:PAS domain S-box-containing protein